MMSLLDLLTGPRIQKAPAKPTSKKPSTKKEEKPAKRSILER